MRIPPVLLRPCMAFAGWLLLAAAVAADVPPPELLQKLDDYPHARLLDSERLDVQDHEIGLGPIQKFRGVWRFENSERLSGTLASYTWQIVDGFTAIEVLEELLQKVESRQNAELLFGCDGRACGHPAQWANRVFGERVLYGRQDRQRYRVYRLEGEESEYRMIIYSAERTSDRQYLHVGLLEVGR